MNEYVAGIDVDVQIDVPITHTELQETLPARLRQAILAATEAAGFAGSGEMALVITNDQRMQELNRTYRGVDSTTDVLAFATMSDGEKAFAAPPIDSPVYLGDMVISLPRAERQAGELGHSLESELCLLAVHGTLHLLGYDHVEPADGDRMWAVQRAALCRLGCEEVAPTDE